MNAFALSDAWRASAPRLTVWPALEAGLAVLVILLFSNALLGPLFATGPDPDSGAVLRLIWPPVYGLTLVLIALRPAPFAALALKCWPLLLLAGLAMISAAWSLDPGVTVRRALGVLMTAVFGLWLAARYSWADFCRLLAVAFACLAFGSLVAGAVFPSFGVMSEIHVGAWKGLWWEKNTLGAMMAWATLAFIAAAVFAPSLAERRTWFALIALSVLLVLLSTSRTALLATFIVTAGPAAIALTRRGFGFAALAIFSGVMGVFALLGVLVIGPAVILEALGRDATLTGRTDIWAALIRAIGAQPWTGYGYGAFWVTDNGPVFWVRQATGWDVPTAHNAWIETALAVGVPGAVLAGLVYLGGLTRAGLRLFDGRETYWALPFLIAWGLISLSESVLLEQNGMVWMLWSATLAKLALGRAQR